MKNKPISKKNSNSFRSHTNIDKYNGFLLELDKKQIEKNENIKNTIKQTIEDEFNINFEDCSGLDLLHYVSNNLNDPNLYINPNTPITKNKPIIKTKVTISAEISDIQDILNLIKKYPINNTIEYNINMEALHKIEHELCKLNNMIGNTSLKEDVVDQIIYFIQQINESNNTQIRNNGDFMHTVIYGPPGTGKSEIANIIGTIFAKMGILKNNVFKKVTRSDLVAGYLGQTSLKTRDVINSCLGGVLFIDEAYSLGNNEKLDSFSKECIDTLCESLSNHKDNLMVIIAGYEQDLNKCFFSHNKGLNSRFVWRFRMDSYTYEDLYNIFLKKVNECGWFIQDNKINSKWFEKNMKSFRYYGRDIETLFTKIKIANSRRVLFLDETNKKQIILEDLEKAFKLYLKNEDPSIKERENKMNDILNTMYL